MKFINEMVISHWDKPVKPFTKKDLVVVRGHFWGRFASSK
jgi:hypothetical protein